MLKCVLWVMVMTCPPIYHPGNFLVKAMNPTNTGLIANNFRYWSSLILQLTYFTAYLFYKSFISRV